MSPGAPIVHLEQVSLWRRTQEEFSYDLKRTILSLLEGKYRTPARKLILDRVSLQVERGETFGIVGSNGSGKSTLLKVIAGILRPTTGSVAVGGTIAPLIELGAGFDQELSVADNIVLYGVLLGFSRAEMLARTGSILEFAELQDYAAMPVKALSSGMTARLGFAIATDVRPDILILDEVLSVGDESFRNKCQVRLETFLQGQATVLVVSHNLEFMKRSCRRAAWLNRGRLEVVGAADEVVTCYQMSVS